MDVYIQVLQLNIKSNSANSANSANLYVLVESIQNIFSNRLDKGLFDLFTVI